MLTILPQQISLKENTYGSILCRFAQLNMFRGTSLQPAEWILFYPYVIHRAKETAKILFSYCKNIPDEQHEQMHGFVYLSYLFGTKK